MFLRHKSCLEPKFHESGDSGKCEQRHIQKINNIIYIDLMFVIMTTLETFIVGFSAQHIQCYLDLNYMCFDDVMKDHIRKLSLPL